METKVNLLISIGNDTLFPLFRQALSVILRQKKSEKFVILSDRECTVLKSLGSVEWITLDKETYQKSSGEASVLQVNRLVNRLESQKFDNVYCFENPKWGRWILSCLENSVPVTLRDYGPERRPMTYSKILEIFEVNEVPMSSQRFVCHSLEELYGRTLEGVKCLLVTDKGVNQFEKELFSGYHDLLTVPQGTICSSKTKKLVEFWSKGQLLSTYAPINDWKFSFHYIVSKKNGWFLNSMDQTFEQFDQIKSLINYYGTQESRVPAEVFDKAEGLRRSRQILMVMINNIKAGMHLFSGIKTQYFSYLIAEQIFSGVCPSRITFFDQKAVLTELEKFREFVDRCQELISRNPARSYK